MQAATLACPTTQQAPAAPKPVLGRPACATTAVWNCATEARPDPMHRMARQRLWQVSVSDLDLATQQPVWPQAVRAVALARAAFDRSTLAHPDRIPHRHRCRRRRSSRRVPACCRDTGAQHQHVPHCLAACPDQPPPARSALERQGAPLPWPGSPAQDVATQLGQATSHRAWLAQAAHPPSALLSASASAHRTPHRAVA